jgi:hypothetical protein
VILVHTIISGAQTGADRGGLLAARDLGLKRGGWAPLGWRSEDGEIPPEFRVGMMQSPSPAYPVRTRANIEASSGTLILSLGPLRLDSGSMLTHNIARNLGKPVRHFVVDGLTKFAPFARRWLIEYEIRTLNVAGPTESHEPGIQEAARDALVSILADCCPRFIFGDRTHDPDCRLRITPDDAGFGG